MSELTQQEQAGIELAKHISEKSCYVAIGAGGELFVSFFEAERLSQVLLSLHGKLEEARKQLEEAQTEIKSIAGILDRLYAPLARSIDNSEKVDMVDVEPMQACMSELMAVWFRLMPGSSKVGIVRAAAKASERRPQG